MFNKFIQDESGATAIEYALIAALLSIGIIAMLKSVKGNLNNTFNVISNELGNAAEAATN